MNRIFFVVLLLWSLNSMAQYAPHDESVWQRAQNVSESYQLAFGRLPQKSEFDYWVYADKRSLYLGTLAGKFHKEFIKGNASLRPEIIARSYQAILGRAPVAEETNYWKGHSAITFYELTQEHVKWLRQNPAEYEKVMHRAAKLVYKRNATAQELAKMKNSNVYSFQYAVALFYDAAQKNPSPATPIDAVNFAGIRKAFNWEQPGYYTPISHDFLSYLNEYTNGKTIMIGKDYFYVTDTGVMIRMYS